MATVHKAHLPGFVVRQANKILDLVIIDAAQEDAVDFKILESGILRSADTREDSVQPVNPGDGPVALRTEGIQADVQPIYAGLA